MVDYMSFDYEMLKKIVELNPMVSTILEGDKSPMLLTVLLSRLPFFGFQKQSGLDQKRQRKNNIILNAWTVVLLI
jgi:hypothetical protein